MKINREIRALKVRLIDKDGGQLGIKPIKEALYMAEQSGLDLIEVAPNANPPVCRIIDYGKFRYQQTKKEKENKKIQHQVKVKEIKFKPNISDNDFNTKAKRAREFIENGDKVRVTCMFRGREMLHMDLGEQVIKKLCLELEDIATVESKPKVMGRTMSAVIASQGKKKKIN